MKRKGLLANLIIVGMSLGTAWAIRGQFGHEQGAAWAGAIGSICILLVAKRADWYAKLFKATLGGAIGWGLGGIMSYGIVVGYGHGSDFVNVYYGFLMLFVIGGLYGFMGGGLFGLVLSDSKKNPVKWALLVIGMTAGGIITYFFLINQWEWLMTPPRSEIWAACLGMAFFLTWFLIKYGNKSALRVAVFSGLGGGFGFALGNFFQVLGNFSDISFNFWNVMEYTLGFLGGIGMAYGTFTSEWETTELVQKKASNYIPVLLVVMFIPLVVWDQSFTMEKLQRNYANLLSSGSDAFAQFIQLLALGLIVAHTIYILVQYHYRRSDELVSYSGKDVKVFFISHFGIYLLFSWLITGAIVSTHRIEQYLYIVNYIIVLLMLPRLKPVFVTRDVDGRRWAKNFGIILLIMASLAFIAINSHEPREKEQKRFENF